MSFDSRFIGQWKSDLSIFKIKADTVSGDGLWYLINKILYSLPDASTFHYGIYSGTNIPFIYRRSDTSTSNSIIGSWRHEPLPDKTSDEGEDLVLREDGNMTAQLDSEPGIVYRYSFELSQEANSLYITTTDLRSRLQTSENAFTLKYSEAVSSGTFEFSTDNNTVTMNYAGSSTPSVLVRI